MPILTPELVNAVVNEVTSDAEKSRRSLSLRRQKIYRDGGKEFLLEKLETEFDADAIREFRLCPINYLKPIIKKRSQVYRSGAIRRTELPADQALIDFWSEELAIDMHMVKANEYLNLHANAALYTFPFGDSLRLNIVPPQLYSIVPNEIDPGKVDIWVFNNFIEADQIFDRLGPAPATGKEGFNRDRTQTGQELIDSDARVVGEKRKFIMWTDESHVTALGNKIMLLNPEGGDDQFINPIQMSPVVHLQRDRDNEAWAQQGEDAVDIALLLQQMWTDLATVIKHHGYGQMVVISEERPTRMILGITKTLHIKRFEGKEAPTVEFLNANSPVAEIKDAMGELQRQLMFTQGLSPAEGSETNSSSGFHAMVQKSDALEAMRADQSILRDSEKSTWEIIKRWHNFMHDQGILREDGRALGKFSEDFGIQIIYPEIKPLETENDRLEVIDKAVKLKLMSMKDRHKRFRPDMTDEDIMAKIDEIKDESKENQEEAMNNLPPVPPPQVNEEDKEEDKEEEKPPGEEE